MAVSLKHKFTSAKADAADTSLVRASNWNDEHDLVLATGKLLGRSTAGTGAAEEISVGTGLSLSSGTLTATGGATRGGDTSTTGSADITLTSSSDLIQRVAMTAAAKKVTLPSATTMNEGDFFLIYNVGAYPFDVRTNGGGLVCVLNAQQAVVTWLNSNATAAGVWTASDATPALNGRAQPGTVETLLSSAMYNCQAAALSSTQAIVVYGTAADEYGRAVIVDVSGTDLTWGTPVTFESAQSYYQCVATLTSTKAIVCYGDVGNSNYGTACILDVSGSTITAGTPVVFESATTNEISVAALSSTKAIVTYQDGGNTNYGTACILDVSGSTITAGTAAVFESATINSTSVAALSSTKAIVCYNDVGNSSYITACILDVSSSTITPGTAVQVAAIAPLSSTNVTSALSSTIAAVTYATSGAGSKCYQSSLSISGSTITAGAENVIIDEANTNPSSCAISAYEIAVLAEFNAENKTHIITSSAFGYVTSSNTIPVAFYGGSYYGSIVKLVDGKLLAVGLDDATDYIDGVIVEYHP